MVKQDACWNDMKFFFFDFTLKWSYDYVKLQIYLSAPVLVY